MSVARKLRTFAFIFRKRPLQAWELLQIRIERRVGVSLYFLSARRIATHLLELLTTRAPESLVEYGNYRLSSDLLPSRPVVFSVGVGEDVTFDEALLSRHEVDIFLFDPTPRSKRFVEAKNYPPNVRFYPLAIADHDGEVELFIDDLESDLDETSSVSIFNRGYQKSGFHIECKRVRSIMDAHDVKQIDVLKLDIEGAAIRVLRDVLKDGIYPTQILCEFERPETLVDVGVFLRDIAGLFRELKELGYDLYRTRALDKGCQIEIAAVRSRALDPKGTPDNASAA